MKGKEQLVQPSFPSAYESSFYSFTLCASPGAAEMQVAFITVKLSSSPSESGDIY
jgi:hypothetical protein